MPQFLCRSVEAISASSRAFADEVTDAKDEINALASQAESHLALRLTAAEPNRLVAFRLESEVVEYLKRVYYFAKRIAKLVAEEDVAYDAAAD